MKPGIPPIPKACDWEAFRHYGHKVVDFIADYHRDLKERRLPIQPNVEPNFLVKSLPGATKGIPEAPTSFDVVLDDIVKYVFPGITHWQHPGFLAYFPCQLSPPALLGEMIACSINQPGFNWMASPAASELEVIVTNWVSKAFGMPQDLSWEGTGGCVLQPSTSESLIVSVIAAQNKALEHYTTVEAKHAARAKLVMYGSEQAHFCLQKSASALNIPYLRKLKPDRDSTGNFAVTAKRLRAAVEEDIQNGLIPFMVSANYGTTATCGVDDFPGIVEVCKKYDLWLNIDAAYAGASAICPEMRAPLLPVFAHADSILVNGSKWFCAQFNCTFFFFRERRYVVPSLNATGEYIANKHSAENAVIDFKDYQLGMGRPFRALKLYTTLRCFGLEGMQAAIRRHCVFAEYLYDALKQRSDLFELPWKQRFGLVCFRMSNDPDDKATKTLCRVFETDTEYLILSTVVEDQTIIRVSFAYPSMTQEDYKRLEHHIVLNAEKVREEQK